MHTGFFYVATLNNEMEAGENTALNLTIPVLERLMEFNILLELTA